MKNIKIIFLFTFFFLYINTAVCQNRTETVDDLLKKKITEPQTTTQQEEGDIFTRLANGDPQAYNEFNSRTIVSLMRNMYGAHVPAAMSLFGNDGPVILRCADPIHLGTARSIRLDEILQSFKDYKSCSYSGACDSRQKNMSLKSFQDSMSTFMQLCKTQGDLTSSLINILNQASPAFDSYYSATEAKEKAQNRRLIAEQQERTREQLARQAQLDNQIKSKKIAEKHHLDLLKAEKIQVNSMNDAIVFHNALVATRIIGYPLITPSSKFYFTNGIIDKVEGNNMIIAKNQEGKYFAVRINRKTITKEASQLRFGGVFGVVGRYAANMKYQTVSGEEKTMAVLEASFITGRL